MYRCFYYLDNVSIIFIGQVLNFILQFTEGVQWFILRKTMIFKVPESEGPTFSRGGGPTCGVPGGPTCGVPGGSRSPILPLDLRMPHRIQPYSYCSEFTNWLKGICTRKSVDQDHVAPS